MLLGIMSYIGSVIASSRLADDTRARTAVSIEMTNAIEEFRESANQNFVSTAELLEQLETTSGLSDLSGVTVRRQIIRDETKTSPPLDLNGDGDTKDTNLDADEVNAAYLLTTVSWIGPNGPESVSWPTILARGEIDPAWKRKESLEDALGLDDDDQAEDSGVSATNGSIYKGRASFELSIDNDKAIHVAAATVSATDPGKITEIVIGGQSIYQSSMDYGTPTGQPIETTPITLSPDGSYAADVQLYPASGDGIYTPSDDTITITLETEAGESISFEVSL